MTLQEMLQADGLSAEEITTLTSNPKYAASLEKLRVQAEEGTTALMNAGKLKEDIEKFNKETVIPYGLKKDQETAAALAEVAKHKAYLKSLKDSGYDIPDAYLEAAPVVKETPVASAGPNYSDEIVNAAKANMSLISMSNKYRALTGEELDLDAEYRNFEQNKRPGENLRAYIDRAYDLPSKEKAKSEAKAAADRKAIEDAAIERWKTEHPQSANAELATPAASKYDKFKSLPEDRRNSYQTEAGRESQAIARQEKYAKILLQ
jgi:hypothetical protein